MPWAASGQISTSPIVGGVEIGEAEYRAALDGMANGKAVSIEGGIFALIDPAQPDPEPEPGPTPPSLAEHAATRRWQVEVGGTIWSGWPVHTDRESQGKIVAEMLAIERGERSDGDGWKFADGQFRSLTNAEFSDLAAAVRNHIRDAFAIEAQVLADIDVGVVTTLEEIDAAFMPQAT